jgi:hypothetical protein
LKGGFQYHGKRLNRCTTDYSGLDEQADGGPFLLSKNYGILLGTFGTTEMAYYTILATKDRSEY